MNRRALLAGCVALVATPFTAESQQAGKVYRIGSLTRGGREAAAPYNRALEEGLGVLGWVDGRNVVFEHRYADLKPERYPNLAAELVRLGVDIVVAPSTPAALAVRQATATIPIVTIVAVDPVGAGLVASLARPGGNVTGLTIDTGPDLGAKLLQLLKEAIPSITRVAVLREPSAQPGFAPYLQAMEIALHWGWSPTGSRSEAQPISSRRSPQRFGNNRVPSSWQCRPCRSPMPGRLPSSRPGIGSRRSLGLENLRRPGA